MKWALFALFIIGCRTAPKTDPNIQTVPESTPVPQYEVPNDPDQELDASVHPFPPDYDDPARLELVLR